MTAGKPVPPHAKGLDDRTQCFTRLRQVVAVTCLALRVTELTLAPGGTVGEHNHVGPGIRLVTSGHMTYVLPENTVIYGPGEFFFESGDINHTVYNKTDAPMVHLLFEILPADLQGAFIDPCEREISDRAR